MLLSTRHMDQLKYSGCYQLRSTTSTRMHMPQIGASHDAAAVLAPLLNSKTRLPSGGGPPGWAPSDAMLTRCRLLPALVNGVAYA